MVRTRMQIPEAVDLNYLLRMLLSHEGASRGDGSEREYITEKTKS